MKRLYSLLLIAVMAVLGPVSIAHAEGTNELGTAQALDAGTLVYATIADSNNEVICWIGGGNVRIYEPGGGPQVGGQLASGGCRTLPAGTNGEYEVDIQTDQSGGSVWDINVCDTSGDGSCDVGDEILGRVYSTEWYFDAGSFAESASIHGSFFALLPGGGPGRDSRSGE